MPTQIGKCLRNSLWHRYRGALPESFPAHYQETRDPCVGVGISRGNDITIALSVIKDFQSYTVHAFDLKQENGRPGKPHYVALRLYTDDKRVRTLASFGWKNEDVIGVAEWFSPWKNNSPIFVKQADTVVDRVRIQYNPRFRHIAQQTIVEILEKRISMLLQRQDLK